MKHWMLVMFMMACGGGSSTTRHDEVAVEPHHSATLDTALDRVARRDVPREHMTLDEAIARGAITMRVQGNGVHQLTMLVTANADLELVIPAGAFFRGNGSVQNMIVTKAEVALIDHGVEERVELATACTNFHKSVPSEGDRFELAAPEPALHRLVVCLDGHHVDAGRTQVLVWEKTDGVKREDMLARPDMLRPYLLARCMRHASQASCRKLVDAAYEHVLDKLLASGDGSVCVEP
jgi:hypothetical protein